MASDLHRVTVALDLAGLPDAAAVVAIRGREEVSRPFRYEVDLVAPEIEVEAARGSSAHLTLTDPEGRVRHISGTVKRIEVLASDGSVEQARYRLHLIPLHQVLDFRNGFRVFQDLSAPDVVQAVVKDAGLDTASLRSNLSGSYPERPYCVQFDETEWAFLCRLLEEEGIWYAFEQGEDGHVLVMADASGDAPKNEPDSLPHVADAGLHGGELRAWGLTARSRTSLEKVVLDDYDFERPSAALRAEAKGTDGHGLWFEYPARAVAPAELKRLARTRLEERRSGRRSIRFRTSALQLQPGRLVDITDHPSSSGSFFVTAVTFHVRLEAEDTAGPLGEAGQEEAWLEVEAVPADQPFRPARITPRPRVHGPQTARVTGPAGEEIHCDKHGRVKLQFHWDRLGALDDQSSCWIRVSQPHSTGSVLIPRVGWEVVVDFLEGDPDRPVCLGRLFNPLFPPSYELPAKKAVTAHRSNSSPGAGGANELRFDDTAGAQELFLNAQHDLAVTAAEKKKVQVGKNHVVTISAKNAEKVTSSETVSVTGKQSASVGGAQQITAGSRSVQVAESFAEEVKGGTTLVVGGAEMVKVGNPVQALVQLAATEAIQQAAGLVGAAAGGAAESLVAPLKPALDAAKKVAGSLPKLGGPAGAMLGGGKVEVPPQAQKAMEAAEPEHVNEAVSSAVTAAVAATAPAAVREITEAMGGGSGSGTVGLTVNGNLTETVGAVQVLSAVGGLAIAVGGVSTETVGAVRIELVGGGRAETTGGNKIETVGGAHLTLASAGIATDAGGNAALNVGGAMMQKIAGSHSISAEGPLVLTSAMLKLQASEKITLKAGKAEVVLDGSGILIKGTMVTLRAGKITVPPGAIGPG
jgi:type VI secretion system secreted protein VgrG